MHLFHCFSCLCRLSQPVTFALDSGLGSSMLATLFVVPCICHYFHVPVAIVKCVKICGFVTIYRGSPAKTLSHTPKMLYGKVLNNIAWGSLSKICKTLHWKMPYLSTSGAALCQLRSSLITSQAEAANGPTHAIDWVSCGAERACLARLIIFRSFRFLQQPAWVTVKQRRLGMLLIDHVVWIYADSFQYIFYLDIF